jgi:hypothetical protein
MTATIARAVEEGDTRTAQILSGALADLLGVAGAERTGVIDLATARKRRT